MQHRGHEGSTNLHSGCIQTRCGIAVHIFKDYFHFREIRTHRHMHGDIMWLGQSMSLHQKPANAKQKTATAVKHFSGQEDAPRLHVIG